MGLAERRALQSYQNEQLPKLLKGLHQAAGFDVPVDIDWDSMTVDGVNFVGSEKVYFTDIFFLPLTDALKAITVDDMGKQALKKGLKKIVMKFDKNTAPISNYESGWTFENGVLTINYEPGVNSGGPDTSYYRERVLALQKILEAKL